MASVINDYEALRKFRGDLTETIEGLTHQLRRTEQAMDNVAAVWKDLQFQKYYEEFSKDKEQIPIIIDRLDQFEGEVLYSLQVKIERYLDL